MIIIKEQRWSSRQWPKHQGKPDCKHMIFIHTYVGIQRPKLTSTIICISSSLSREFVSISCVLSTPLGRCFQMFPAELGFHAITLTDYMDKKAFRDVRVAR